MNNKISKLNLFKKKLNWTILLIVERITYAEEESSLLLVERFTCQPLFLCVLNIKNELIFICIMVDQIVCLLALVV